jgi:hypothetical protein
MHTSILKLQLTNYTPTERTIYKMHGEDNIKNIEISLYYIHNDLLHVSANHVSIFREAK